MTEKVVSISRGKDIRLKRELKQHGPISVAYLCAKYGSNTFIELLERGEVSLDAFSLVYLNEPESEDEEPRLRVG